MPEKHRNDKKRIPGVTPTGDATMVRSEQARVSAEAGEKRGKGVKVMGRDGRRNSPVFFLCTFLTFSSKFIA